MNNERLSEELLLPGGSNETEGGAADEAAAREDAAGFLGDMVATMPTVLHFNCRPGAAANTVELAELVALKDEANNNVSMDDGDAGGGGEPSDIGEEDLQALRESALPSPLKQELLLQQQPREQPAGKPSPPSAPGLPLHSRTHTPEQQAVPSIYKTEDQPVVNEQPPLHLAQLPPRQMSVPPEAMGLPPMMRPAMGGPGMMAPPQGPPPHTHPNFPQVPVVSLLQPPGPPGQLRDLHGGFPGATAPPFPPCPWFDPSAITKEEVDELRVSFPSLRVCRPATEGDRNNLAYLTLRNTLIDVYRTNPGQKLTLAECRKHCDGDLAALLRVLSFLERNRLVNFCIDTSQAPTGGMADTRLRNELAKQWGRTPTCTACDRICLYSFYILSPSAYGAAVPLPHLKAAVWCPDCAREAPHNQFLLKVNLPALHVSGGATSWSEPQINVLFDAVETHGSDWIQISKIVSSVPGNPIRSPRECLAAFLSMPITEPVQAMNPPPKCDNKETAAPEPTPPASKPPQTNWNVQDQDPAAVSLGLEILVTAMELIKKRGDKQPEPMLDGLSRMVQDRMEQRVPAASINDLSFMQ
eukprot:Gregarina_sp_Pseudo_9__1103@NODE_171_length_3858_cov_32_301650_g158_i0_p1_GENE_NODE_171_length_3858_cov_32_301650_g158_i0NODE_171_length_3858_cov_32_301650_g158_i0_p1_ORF_typecomplete_len583_score98_53SWIRM/PF04433_17/1_6e14Myb_DNAbind_6/PF13921_6/0_0074Myb_DNAbinding/PF00249_31/0_06_NODE_171_length_3858_cov_32_301650_g158_i013853133